MKAFFSDSELFKKMAEPEKELVSGICSEIRLKKDEGLFRENDKGDSVFFVAEGMIRISKNLSTEETITLAIAKKNDIFGEMAVFDISPRYADAVAISETVVYSLKKDDYIAFRDKNPKAAFALMDVITASLGVRLRKLTDKVYGIY